MSEIPQNWRDLAALLDPLGCCTDALADKSSLDWYGIYALAATNLVAPSLYSALLERGRLQLAPTEVREALRELHRLNQLRNYRQRSVLRDVTRILNARGIEPLLMKGSIALAVDQRSGLTDRMMSDLDIALHNASPDLGEQALLSAGFWHAPDQGPMEFIGSHHLAPLFHPSGEGYVEVHRDLLGGKIPRDALSLEQVCGAATPVYWEGLRLWIPSIEHRLVHNALHYRVQDISKIADGCLLRSLLEFVQLNATPAAVNIDWSKQIQRLDDYGLGNELRVYLLLAKHLFNQPMPMGIHLDKAIHKSVSWMWFWMAHPRLYRSYMKSKRLKSLPARLLTPSWYPKKFRYIRREWRENHRGRLD